MKHLPRKTVAAHSPIPAYVGMPLPTRKRPLTVPKNVESSALRRDFTAVEFPIRFGLGEPHPSPPARIRLSPFAVRMGDETAPAGV